jgi:glycosyltransferase involved in cell wall biosynthesis
LPEKKKQRVSVIIPVLNEEGSIASVIGDIPRSITDDIVVVDNGCTDSTSERARNSGARVVVEPRRGYGNACLKGLEAARDADIVVFLDGDYSDYPEEMISLVDKLNEGYDMVVGSRMRGRREPGALPAHSMFGNWLVCSLINLVAGTEYTDLGPFRAVRYEKLMSLGMRDPNYGWTVEMALRAASGGWRVCEIPARYRKRSAGESKVTGSPIASFKTAIKMFAVLIRLQGQVRRDKKGRRNHPRLSP